MGKGYLKTEFRDWLKKQTSNRGEPYKTKTVRTYIRALSNDPSKLNGISLEHDDIFHYVTLEEYRKAKETIIHAPNYDDINIQSGNGAFSAGMNSYEKFLTEYLQPSCWIFQGNPKYYDVLGAVKDLNSIQWSVKQYKNRIKQGDYFYLWMSGPDGGIVASGSIGCDPEERELNPDDQYVIDDSFTGDAYIAVDLIIEKRLLDSVITRKMLLEDDRTHKLDILTYPNATNFHVTKEQQHTIESIINGTYRNIPVKQEEETLKEKRRYWVYAPGEGSRFWEQYYQEGIMGIGWDGLGDLSKYDSKEAMKTQLKAAYGQDRTYKNDAHATWQFANEMSPGDIVYVKKGTTHFIGRGIVSSGYRFDDGRQEYKNIRDVKWTHNGEWEYYSKIVQKTLTDITQYNSYFKYLESLFAGETEADDIDDQAIEYPTYTEEDFLNEVYMDQANYTTLRNLLLKKKNIILQGAPGVGKRFVQSVWPTPLWVKKTIAE